MLHASYVGGSFGLLRRQGQGLMRADGGVDNVEQVLGEGVTVLETGTAHCDLAYVLELGLDGAIGLECDGVVGVVVAACDSSLRICASMSLRPLVARCRMPAILATCAACFLPTSLEGLGP